MNIPDKYPAELRPITTIISIISELFDLLDPQMAFMMMQPNVILALAGIKPVADMCDISPESETLQKLPQINEILSKYGLRLYVVIKPGEPDYYGGIESSLGLERATNLTKFPFVIKYKYTSNPNDFLDWKKDMKLQYQNELVRGHFTEKEMSMIKQGLEMGYPDQAIQDLLYYYKVCEGNRINVPAYLRYLEEGRVSESLKEKVAGKEIYVTARLHIPEEYREESPLPLFSYNYKSKDDDGINNWVNAANRVLEAFYTSEWYKAHRI